MGEFSFIDGIGDEVVLFVGFLALSVIFLILVGLPKRGAREGNNETAIPVGRQQDESQPAATTIHAPNETLTVARETETGGSVRHRSTGFSTSDTRDYSASSSGDSNERRRETVEEEETDSYRQDEAFTIRIVKAGSSDHPLEVQVTNSTTVNEMRNNHFRTELSQNKAVRFIYQGRLVPDDTTIANLGITGGGAMHVHVGRPQQNQGHAPPAEQQTDLSRMFLPMLGLILGIVWMAMLNFPYIFTFFTKLFLFALSFGYVMLTYFSTVGTGNRN